MIRGTTSVAFVFVALDYGRLSSCSPLKFVFELQPQSPEGSAWMQGLMLALSHGALGRLGPQRSLPQLQGPLARGVKVEMEWWNFEDKVRLWRERCRCEAALKESEGEEAINWRQKLDEIRKQGLQNSWPPTSGENYLPLMLLRRAQPLSRLCRLPCPHRRTFSRLA